MRAQLIFPNPSPDAVRCELDVVLIFTALLGQEAYDCCHCGELIDEFTRVGRKYHGLANSEFVAHRWYWMISQP
jgi:hypothetical protein